MLSAGKDNFSFIPEDFKNRNREVDSTLTVKHLLLCLENKENEANSSFYSIKFCGLISTFPNIF